jgi:hypothetical protein
MNSTHNAYGLRLLSDDAKHCLQVFFLIARYSPRATASACSLWIEMLVRWCGLLGVAMRIARAL